jgi:hypothetical protein
LYIRIVYQATNSKLALIKHQQLKPYYRNSSK